MKTFRKFAAAALGAALMAAPAAAFAQDWYGAVAFSQSTGDSGWTKNYGTQAEAESEAMRYCRETNGANDCKVYAYVNACFALAVGGDNGFGTDWGVNITAAENKAMHACSGYSFNCKVVVSQCSTGR